MATAVSSATSAAVATQQTVSSGTRDTSNNTSSDPFQTILAQTTNASQSAQSPQAAREANQAAFNAETAAQDEKDRLDQTAQASDDAAAALLAAQLGLTQLATTNTPITTDGTPAPTSPTASDAQKLTVPQTDAAALLGPPTQTNPLFRQAVAEAGRQNNTQVPGSVTQTTPPADAVPTVPAPVAATTPTPAANPLPEAPTAQPAQTNTLASAVAAVQPGQRQVVPVQAPVVPAAAPAPTDAAANAGLPTPVTAPQAPVEAAGVPAASVGDRPGTAGDQFAAIASAASTLTASPAPAVASGFAPVLATTAAASATLTAPAATAATAAANAASLVPNQLAEPTERRTTEDGFGDVASSAGLAPTLVQPQGSNSVSAAQTPTAVKTPDPVAQVADHIITHAHVVVRGGETEFRMRLDPPELGALKIRLVSDGDSIHGQVVVSNDAVRRMIESQLPELRQRLEDAGVSVQNFNVSTDTNSGAGANTNGGEWGGYRSEFPAEQPRIGAPAPRPAVARTRGAVDVMA